MSDQPEIRIHYDPLRPGDYERREAEPGERLIDWLSAAHPAGFGRPVVLHLNGRPLPIAQADVVLQRGDLVHVLVQPGLPAAVGTLIVQALVSAAIAAVASIAFSLIYKPKRPNAQEAPAPDPIYSITGAQVAARLGEPVPVLFGQVVTVPDYAAQPYVYFENNDQWLAQLLVIGQGKYDLEELLIGETPVSAMQGDAVQFQLFGPADHGQAMGAIEAATGIMENVVTSAEVGDQELSGADMSGAESEFGPHSFNAPNEITTSVAPPAGLVRFQVSGSDFNDGFYTLAGYAAGLITTVENTLSAEEPLGSTTLTWFESADERTAGPFITNKPGVQGDKLILDFIWPAGLFEIDDETGQLLPLTVDFVISHQRMSDAGAPIGGYTDVPFTVTEATNTAVRRTYEIPVPPGRYRVKVTRLTPEPANASQTNNFIWAGLKFRILPSVGPVYGPVTLLAIRIRATNGISSSASGRIRARVQRLLPPMGSGLAVPSRSPADAFCDVLANPIYGAGRPLSEIDLVELARIAASWGGQAEFNGAFAQRSTIWEALNIVLQTANAAPLPTGQVMSVAQDGPKASRRQLFSDANMVRGSLAVGYTFDRPGDYDGIRVEYRDPVTWNPLYSTFPPGAQGPDQVQLFGCSDGAQAAQFAKLLWQKRTRLRKTATFETELEGLLARMGDRIAIAADLPRWGMSGVVVAVSGLVIWLDKAPDWSGTGHLIILRDEFGGPSAPIAVTPGADPNAVQLAALPPFPLFPTGPQESTHYAFGDSVRLVRDFTVQTMQPRGGALVAIEALTYDPAAWAATLPWLETPT